MEFEWDDEKERQNIAKYGIRFLEAKKVFLDPFRIEQYDLVPSNEEDRWQTIGLVNDVLFVVYTERGDKTRIIMARKAEPEERRIYYGHSYPYNWYRIES
jgi:uncharacterized DUF497 family protein